LRGDSPDRSKQKKKTDVGANFAKKKENLHQEEGKKKISDGNQSPGRSGTWQPKQARTKERKITKLANESKGCDLHAGTSAKKKRSGKWQAKRAKKGVEKPRKTQRSTAHSARKGEVR